MKGRGWTLAIAACALLLGCETMKTTGEPGPQRKDTQRVCEDASAECPVTVKLQSSCPTLNDCLGVDFEFVIAGKEKVTITWRLFDKDQSDYSFYDKKADGKDGIEFAEGDEHFKCETVEKGKSVRCRDLQKNVIPKVYKYTIHVKKMGGWWPVTVDPLDPFVVNH